MPPPKTVLIVEASADEREVLRTVLERRGLRIFEADGADEGLQLARDEHPDVIVLDMDARALEDGSELSAAFDQACGDPTNVIVLGTVRSTARLPADQVIAKPYHFGPLVRKIEELAAKAA
jgi:CheY-like chemotaxis protein